MKTSKDEIPITDSIQSIPKVLTALSDLDLTLPNTALANLKVFNHTYLIITQNVYKEVKNNGFKNGEKMTQLDLDFASYYFNAIHNYKDHSKLAPAWEIALDYCKNRKSYRLIYLMLIANAHINNDLAFSLKHIVKNENFYSDYQKAGCIITRSVKEIMQSLNQIFPPRNLLDKHLTWLYDWIIKLLIKNWRKNAWNNYRKLSRNEITEQSIQVRAADFAEKIILVTNIAMLGMT